MLRVLVTASALLPVSAFAGSAFGVPAPAVGAFGPLGLAAAAVGYIGWRIIKKRGGA